MLFAFDLSIQYCIYRLPSTYPLEVKPIENKDIIVATSAGLGVWSRYAPLSLINYIGEIRILDRVVFYLFRIENSTTNILHFYITNAQMLRLKQLKNIFYFQLLILQIKQKRYKSINHLRNTSGFLGIPSKNFSFFVCYQRNQLIFLKEILLEFEFKEENLNQIFGGDFQIFTTIKLQVRIYYHITQDKLIILLVVFLETLIISCVLQNIIQLIIVIFKLVQQLLYQILQWKNKIYMNLYPKILITKNFYYQNRKKLGGKYINHK